MNDKDITMMKVTRGTRHKLNILKVKKKLVSYEELFKYLLKIYNKNK